MERANGLNLSRWKRNRSHRAIMVTVNPINYIEFLGESGRSKQPQITGTKNFPSKATISLHAFNKQLQTLALGDPPRTWHRMFDVPVPPLCSLSVTLKFCLINYICKVLKMPLTQTPAQGATIQATCDTHYRRVCTLPA